jgi:hypothetical protein
MDAVYPLWKQSLENGDANADLVSAGANGVFAALVTSAYVYSAAHQFYSSLAGVVGVDQPVTTPTVVNGLFRGDNLVFPTVAGGSTVVAIVLYRKNGGANTTWRLVAFFDTAAGLPYVTNGADIDVNWSASGILQL